MQPESAFNGYKIEMARDGSRKVRIVHCPSGEMIYSEPGYLETREEFAKRIGTAYNRLRDQIDLLYR